MKTKKATDLKFWPVKINDTSCLFVKFRIKMNKFKYFSDTILLMKNLLLKNLQKKCIFWRSKLSIKILLNPLNFYMVQLVSTNPIWPYKSFWVKKQLMVQAWALKMSYVKRETSNISDVRSWTAVSVTRAYIGVHASSVIFFTSSAIFFTPWARSKLFPSKCSICAAKSLQMKETVRYMLPGNEKNNDKEKVRNSNSRKFAKHSSESLSS